MMSACTCTPHTRDACRARRFAGQAHVDYGHMVEPAAAAYPPRALPRTAIVCPPTPHPAPCPLFPLCLPTPHPAAATLQVMNGDHGPMPPQYSSSLHDLLRSLLHPSASQRPSMAQLLSLPLLRRFIASYAVSTLGGISEEQQLTEPALSARPHPNHLPGR